MGKIKFSKLKLMQEVRICLSRLIMLKNTTEKVTVE